MYNEDTSWFNQSLYSYKDNMFGSNSSFEVSISCNTNDFKYFSAPSLQLSIITITDKTRRTCNLSYVDVIDLILKIKQIQKDIKYAFDTGSQFLCKYQNGRSLTFSFLTAKQMNNEKVIEIDIRYNEGDFGKVYLPFGSVFLAFVKKLEIYSNTCDQLSISITNRFLYSNIFQQLSGMRGDIKGIPDQISTSIELTSTPDIIPDSDKLNVKNEIQDNFVGYVETEIDNIVVPEITSTEKKEVIQEFNSPFIFKLLNGNIRVLEDLIFSYITKPNPFMELIRNISVLYEKEILPGFTDDDNKSYSYISSLIFHTHLQNYTKNNIPIPATTNILKYDGEEFTNQQIIELLYDVFIIGCYIKIVRERLSDKEPDAIKNKSVLHIAYRCFTDVLIFSFLDKVDSNAIKTCISERFKSYSISGIFKEFDEILKSYGCTAINQMDINTFTSQIIDNIMGKKGDNITNFHNNLYHKNDVVLPSINKLSLEQINDLVKLEVEKKVNSNFNVSNTEFPEEILHYFKAKTKTATIGKPNKTTKVNGKKEPHVYRLAKQYRNEIPETKREIILEHLKNISNSDFVWVFEELTPEELGENILKILYVWNESSKNGTFKEFVSEKFEQCMLSRELLITKIRNIELAEDKTTDENWDNIEF